MSDPDLHFHLKDDDEGVYEDLSTAQAVSLGIGQERLSKDAMRAGPSNDWVLMGDKVYMCDCGAEVVRASVLYPADLTDPDNYGHSRNTYWDVKNDIEHEHPEELEDQ